MDTERKENSDLLPAGQKSIRKSSNLIVQDLNNSDPPDGGLRAFSVLIGSFLTNGLVFGVINSYSVIYNELLQRLNKDNVENAEVKASMVGVLTIGTTFFLSPLSGTLTGILGLRTTAVLGGSIAALGMLISSFVVDHVDALCFTYGIMFGLGASLAYTPSLAILGHYYKKYLGIVNGVVTVGSPLFTVIMVALIEYLIKGYSLELTFRVLAILTFGIALCGLLFKPYSVVEKPEKKEKTFKWFLKTVVNTKLWKIRNYRLWALSMPIALFGYFVPYVHIKKFIEELHFEGVNENLPLQCMAVASGFGRLVFGFLGDRPKIDNILLQQISFYVIGALTIILPFIKSFELLVVIAIGMGLFEGGFIALIGPIAFEICGGVYAAQAIGCMLGMAATPLSVGPPIAGAIHSNTRSYMVPFILAGLSPIIGATFMFLIRCGRREKSEENEIQISPDPEKGPVPLLASNGDAHKL